MSDQKKFGGEKSVKGLRWAFQYTNSEAGWDSSASTLKVHPGLKEHAKLREDRTQ